MNALRFHQMIAAVALLCAVASRCPAVTPGPAEMDDAARWTAVKFEGVQRQPATQPCLIVIENHGPVQLDARGSEPLQIAGKSYRRGLYCHAPSNVLVRVPANAVAFHAEVGVDARAGGGSVVFSVRAAQGELARTDVLHVEHPAKTIDLPIRGVTELNLAVSDAGDGITSDQADWADARVKLEDGSEIELSDLPLVAGPDEIIDPAPPFSFVLNGRPSRELLPAWKCERTTVARDGFREHEITYSDAAGGLSVRCAGVEWNDSPTVEWTLYFKNIGKEDSPMIEKIRAIETTFPAPAAEACNFHYNFGDDCVPQSYEPHADAMPVGFSKSIANTGGRPTQIAFPYFNFTRQSRGQIVVIGWPGQWSAQMGRDDHGINVAGGQELTHFRLHPGEEVRSPRVVVQFYRGDWIRGQNLWRRWMVLHNMPHPGGKPMQPQALLCTGNFYPGLMSDAKQELAFLKQHIDAGVKFDAWWQDAGWYPCDGVTWPKTGTWEVDRGRFPNGLREVSDFVHANNRKSIVWFEPERVQEGTWLAENHPEWIHGGSKGGLLKLSEPKCREWLIEHIDKLLTDEGIDIYRQDFNIDPLSYWRAADTEDRQGITEIRHVEGYLAFWDELLRRHPQMYIDSCSSGGRRNDIETMKRTVPLLRSDWYNGTDGQQSHTYGLSLWLPYQGTGAIYPRDRYWFISSMVSSLTYGPAGAGVTENDLTIAREMTDLHRKMGDCFLGDFYPLTPYTLSPDAWMAWQYDQPEKGTGVVQAFRRSQSIFEVARLRLTGLKRDAAYEITDLQTNAITHAQGSDLIEQGLRIEIGDRPGAVIMRYRQMR